jgi:hypothetical protein
MKTGLETIEPKLKTAFEPLAGIKQKMDKEIKSNSKKLLDFIPEVNNLRMQITNELARKFELLGYLLEKHSEHIKSLEIIEKFPSVYEKAIDEIRRRQVFKKDYETLLRILQDLADDENKKRTAFRQQYDKYLPFNFLGCLAVSFPMLNFDNIRKKIEQDTPITLDLLQKSSYYENGSNRDIVKMIDST